MSKNQAKDAGSGKEIFCVIAETSLSTARCPVTRCMYRDRKTGRCEGASLKDTLPENESSKLSLLKDFYRVTEAEIHDGVKRVRLATEVANFFFYLFDKTILEAKTKDFEELYNSKEKYENWKGKSALDPFSFEEISEMASFMFTKL